MTAEEINARAGEYVLGTLPPAERRAVEIELPIDPALARAVRAWEDKLTPLTAAVPVVSPPPALWTRIEARMGPARPQVSPVVAAGAGLIDNLKRRVAIWRTAASLSGAIAVGLAVVLVAGRTFTPSAGGEHYVAVVNADGALPAMMVDVNTGTGIVSVMSVASEAPAGRSRELWYIGANQAPRSLGVIDDTGQRIAIPAGQITNFSPNAATFAVSDEPEGGSPTGSPTGAILYSGQLFLTDR